MHKCGGEVVSLALYSSATPCHHAVAHQTNEEVPPCHRSADTENSGESKGCCEDDYNDQDILEIEVIPDNSQWQADIDFELPVIMTRDIKVSKPYFLVGSEYLNYKPPLIEPDLLILKQVFLI